MRGIPAEVGAVLVLGASRSGRAAAQALRMMGRRVILSDSKPGADLPGLEDLEAVGVDVRTGSQGPELLEGVDLIVKSPGIPGDITLLETARRRDIPIWSEVELAYRALPNEFGAVTGTNGKTTTTSLLGHLLNCAGRSARVLGNIGTAVSAAVGAAGPDEQLVVEVSSFQLEDTHEFRPHIAVFLNLTPDHLDRHGTMRAYRAAKERLFGTQGPEDVAVLNVDDAVGRELADRLRCASGGPEVLTFSVSGVADADSWLDGDDLSVLGDVVAQAGDLSIRGAHNMENALAAATAARAWGVAPAAIGAGLATFAGVEHRLQQAGTIAGVTYVNDSKATNVEATTKALAAYPAGTHLILGGRDKGADYRPVARACIGACSAVYLIGEAAQLIRDAFAEVRRELAARGEGRNVPQVLEAGDLETAVAVAARRAQPGETVLLAPACASFDQYVDYEERGRHFMSIVAEMEGGE